VTSATSSSVTAAAATFYTTGSKLAVLPVAVRSPEGAWQFRRVASNTGTAITLDTTDGTPWSQTPAAGWTVYVGPIEWYWRSPWLEYGVFEERKNGELLCVQAKTTSHTTVIDAEVRLDDSTGVSTELSFSFPATGAVWDVSLWDAAVWGDTGARGAYKQRLGRNFFSLQLGFSNYKPQEPVRIVQFSVGSDQLPRKKVAGAA
jgi:hypothetical protein